MNSFKKKRRELRIPIVIVDYFNKKPGSEIPDGYNKTTQGELLTGKPTVMLKRAISFFPAFKEIGVSNLKVISEPFPDALAVKE